MRRLLSAVLIVALAASLLAGCSDEQRGGPDGGSQARTSASGTTDGTVGEGSSNGGETTGGSTTKPRQ
jgi:hypothetical protein